MALFSSHTGFVDVYGARTAANASEPSRRRCRIEHGMRRTLQFSAMGLTNSLSLRLHKESTTYAWVSDERRLSLARISHHLPVEARNRPAITALRLLAVLNVLFKYTSARRAAQALY